MASQANKSTARTCQKFKEKAKAFMASRAENAIGRHQIIVYLLHSVIVAIVITMQFTGLGGSHDALPMSMSGVHLTACLTALSLYLLRKISLPVAFSVVALVAQAAIVCRFVYFIHMRPDHFLQLILVNQMISLLAVVFLVMCFVRYTPFVVAAISLTTYGGAAAYLREPALWNLFAFFLPLELFLCILGEILHRNVRNVQTENTNLHDRETALMQAVRLNEREIEAYLRICSNDHPLPEDTDRLFGMLRPKSQHNLIHAIRQHLKSHLMDDNDLARLFPMLTKSEVDVCNLILQGKKMNEIGQLLDKTEKNIGVVRTHIRKKLNVPPGQDLRKYLMELLVEKGEEAFPVAE
ncbi:MAG: LuxR C-terminal-related transcriptional regulator [Prevotellaceae bacterium]|nr:LuxR C-terminal-related transcriptional regulator [Prevotellaceae bacterium]MDY6130070.1 LuxR C-terminal-related transcriptional regulator [Prevotella sp.]